MLVLRGPAGIGKTSLLDAAVASAKDFTSSCVAGAESEIALGFAAVHQLVLPFLGRVGDLPGPQRHTLESVFGLADHGPPDPLLVFLGVLTLLDSCGHAAAVAPRDRRRPVARRRVRGASWPSSAAACTPIRS